MELDKKRFSIRQHITLVLTLLTVLIVLLIGVCVAVVREQSRTRLTSAADSYLSLLTRTLENQLVIQESYITSQVLNSEELHRLGFGEGHTQAYLDSYKLHTGFSSAMAAGNDVTALYLYSEPNSILMSEYATAQAGRPTETQIQKTNLEETLRSMVDAKTLNDERWTPYVVSGQQYWVRAVHYYGAWLISVVNPDRPLTVQITAKSLPMEGKKLVNITVRDNGDGFPEKVMKELNSGKQMATGHYGLTNVQRRCALLFGPDFAMTFTNAAAGGAVVEMYIPLPDAAEEAKEEEKHETVDRG